MSNTEVGGVSTAENETIESMLALDELELDDLEIGAEEHIEEEVVEAGATVIDGELDEETARALEATIVKSEIYDEAGAGSDVTADAPPSENIGALELTGTEEEAPKKTRKARSTTPKAPKAPKIERDLNALPLEAFQMAVGIPATEDDKKELIAKRPAQKKIAEKFDQTIAVLHAGRKPSVYVMDLFRVLKDKGTVTSTELVAAMKAMELKNGSKTYNDGTARSQVGQIMALFSVLGIATRTGQTLTLNNDSAFASKLELHL